MYINSAPLVSKNVVDLGVGIVSVLRERSIRDVEVCKIYECPIFPPIQSRGVLKDERFKNGGMKTFVAFHGSPLAQNLWYERKKSRKGHKNFLSLRISFENTLLVYWDLGMCLLFWFWLQVLKCLIKLNTLQKSYYPSNS